MKSVPWLPNFNSNAMKHNFHFIQRRPDKSIIHAYHVSYSHNQPWQPMIKTAEYRNYVNIWKSLLSICSVITVYNVVAYSCFIWTSNLMFLCPWKTKYSSHKCFRWNFLLIKYKMVFHILFVFFSRTNCSLALKFWSWDQGLA